MIFQKIQKVKETLLQHKLRAAIAIIAVVFGGYYFGNIPKRLEIYFHVFYIRLLFLSHFCLKMQLFFP